jgi:hypothetical protein
MINDLSLRDKNHSPIEAPRIISMLMGINPGLNGAKIGLFGIVLRPEGTGGFVLTLGTVPPLRRALKGRQVECVNSTHLTI